MESKYHKSAEEIEQEFILIQQSKQDPACFAPLYEKYHHPIFLFIYKKTLDKELSGEITSIVFSKALQALPSYQSKGLPFSSWLYRIAANETAYYFRKSKRTEHVYLDDTQIHRLQEEVPADEDTTDSYLKALGSVLSSLKETEVQLIQWRFFENKSFKEVGEFLQMTENNAKVKTYRLLEKLKKMIQSKNNNA